MASDLERAKAGDSEALADLVHEHYDAVHRFCALRVGPDLAPDAAQETFLTACRKLRTYRGDGRLTTWLFGIANNHCRNLARKRRMNTLEWLDPAVTDSAARRTPSPDSEAAIDRELLRSALRSLSAEYRDVVLLKEVEGLTYDEVGAVLGIPAGTVKSRLHHAYRQLRAALLGEETDR
ncbi:MAG: sigma-70 family RNA polymerase sigma factor [Fimbriimonadaceae bacterium]